MKKLIFIIIIGLFFCEMKTFSQIRKAKIKVNGVEIFIPIIFKDFSILNRKYYTYINISEREAPSFFYIFMDNTTINNFKKGKIINDNKIKYIAICQNPYDDSEYDSTEFSKEKKRQVVKITDDYMQQLDSIKLHYNDTIFSNHFDNRNRNNIDLGCFYENKNSFGNLLFSIEQKDTIFDRNLLAINYINIKNRLIFAVIAYTYNGNESINWVITTSKTWVKEILDANK